MEPGGILLCAIDTDERAPNLVATARAWAAATRCRPFFVHGCATGTGAAVPEALTALGVAERERLLQPGDPPAVITAAIARIRPVLLLMASSANGDARLGHVADAMLQTGGAALAIVPRGAAQGLSGKAVVCAVSLGDRDEVAIRFAHTFTAVAGARLALRPVLGSRDAALLAARRARTSVAEPASGQAETGGRAEVLAQRLLEIAHDADPAALVIASRPGDAASRALETSAFWSAVRCPVVAVRP